MSLNALTNIGLSRRDDYNPRGPRMTGYDAVAQASGRPEPVARTAGAPTAPTSSAVQAAIAYIPTEIVTLYLALVNILHPELGPARVNSETQAADPATNAITITITAADWWAFWVFVAATPVVYWITFAVKLNNDGKALPLSPRQWPLLQMFAATAAFVAWAIAIPQSGFVASGKVTPGIAGFLPLLVTAVIGLVSPLLLKPIHATPAPGDRGKSGVNSS